MKPPVRPPIRWLAGAWLLAACGSSPSASEPVEPVRDASITDATAPGQGDAATADADRADTEPTAPDTGVPMPDTPTDAANIEPERPVYRQRLASRDPVPLRFFGKALDLDGRRIAIGATGSDDGVDGAGRVTIFEEVAGRWELGDVLLPFREDPRPFFGRALSLHDDTLWVGSHGEDGEDFGDDAGALDRVDLRTRPPAPNAQPLRGPAGGHLGLSVSANARWVCVGAPRAGVDEAGEVYIAAADAPETVLVAATGQSPGAWLGVSATALEDGCVFGADGTRDGVRQAGDTVRCTEAGCEPLPLTDPDGALRPPVEGARAGAAVDANATFVAVGAPGAATVVGQVAVGDLRERPVAWQWLTSPQTNDDFGASVAFAGERLIVGAPLGDGASQGARDGIVYVYERQAQRWVLTETVRSPREQTGAEFGHAVAGDARWLVATARFDDGDVDRSGAAYVFEWMPGP